MLSALICLWSRFQMSNTKMKRETKTEPPDIASPLVRASVVEPSGLNCNRLLPRYLSFRSPATSPCSASSPQTEADSSILQHYILCLNWWHELHSEPLVCSLLTRWEKVNRKNSTRSIEYQPKVLQPPNWNLARLITRLHAWLEFPALCPTHHPSRIRPKISP
jgi:hypothetical protein